MPTRYPLLALALLASPLAAQRHTPRSAHPATIREYRHSFPTYPFSDPDPVPAVGRIYPYFRFDGFTDTAVPRSWTVVELENAYLRVLILPEIGGKIWAAIDKRSGRPFIYYNHVVKFRDIAMRGPWTSGGIEANYGILGHTPNVSTPVDYTLRRNADGSVSCITGVLDLLTGTTWRLETRLAPDEASFSTASRWYNGTPLEQPYYTWMTAAIPVDGDLQYLFPGTSWIGHNGEHGEWPVDSATGRDLSRYDQNDFGPYKSYHVFGAAGDFFGAYWRDHDFGMARVAPRDEKPGQKIWIWGLSRQGMLWEQLLTDTDGQYSELQSGRLFNQTAEPSTYTPFKFRGFTPHGSDRWTERWMPVEGIGGFVTATAAGALNVTRSGDRLVLAISPALPLDDSLIVTTAGRRLLAIRVVRAPLHPFIDTIAAPGVPLTSLKVVLGDDRLVWEGDPARSDLARPLETPADFDWSSPYGLFLKGHALLRQREYDRAAATLDSALAGGPYFVPALTDRAALAIRAMGYDSALALTRRALSIDTYDAAANYYYGVANRRLGHHADARDGFEIASQSVEYRAAAWTELAKLWLAEDDHRRAADYAAKALAVDPADLDALGVRVVLARRAHADPAAPLAALEAADPLSQLARYERLLALHTADAPVRLRAGVRSELPEQQLFALAAWYQDIGEREAARQVLEGTGDRPEALYWRALLLGSSTPAARALVQRADTLSPRFVFPFRPEVITALEAALPTTGTWRPRYYLALGYAHTGRIADAQRLLASLGDTPDFAPFYAVRASLPGAATAQLADLTRAAALDPAEWRYGRLLTERKLAAGDTAGAVTTARDYSTRFPANYILGVSLVHAQLAAGRYADADSVLTHLTVLPYEGMREGHAQWREAKLMLAVDAIRGSRWLDAAALIAAAREWPERLGAGRPYDVDERLEEWLLADVQEHTGHAAEAAATRTRLTAWAAERSAHPAEFGLEGAVLARWRAITR